MEILGKHTESFDIIACPAGTGATAAGIILSAQAHQEVYVFGALKGESYTRELVKSQLWKVLMDEEAVEELMQGCRFFEEDRFGGFGRFPAELCHPSQCASTLSRIHLEGEMKWSEI